jgi:squalene synthase HpnC
MSGTASVELWSGKDRGDENFPVGSLLIRRDLRRHVHAFYAFARNADDIADHPELAPEEKIRRLDLMEAVLIGAADAALAPSAAALRESLSASGVSARHACDLLVAFRQDARKQRYETWEELLEYCRHSAMPVGRHVLDLHGERPEEVYPPSDALCAALQVLNHLQDCASDLRRLDRCYIPRLWLAREGGSEAWLTAPAAPPGLRAVFAAMLDATDELIAQATHLPARVRNPRLARETAIIVALARRLARRLRRGDPLAARVALSPLDFALAALRGLFRRP